MLDAPGVIDAADQERTGIIAIAELIEAIGNAHPGMSDPLERQTGVMLYSALDAHGDGSLQRPELHEVFAAAVLSQPKLQELISEEVRGIPSEL